MSNPTSNFGWQMPTPVDLVTDLPADFEVFGQAVDSSLADLKGGTTGQILAKATNTDMDFTWITNDVGDITAVTAGTGISGGGTSGAVTVTNSMATTMTTKGDLVPATGSGTFARLAAGSNGETLVADSSTSTGLRYQAPKTQNALYNSGFDIAQRGTSFTGLAGADYTLDRWVMWATTGGQSNYASQQSVGNLSVTPNQATRYCGRFGRTAGTTNTGGRQVFQTLETNDSIRLAGQTVTFSFYARAGADYSQGLNALQFYVTSGTGTDQILYSFTGSATVIGLTTATLFTSWRRFTATGTVPTNATQVGLGFVNTPSGTAGAADFFEITGVQLEVGSVATPFNRMSGTIQGELAACQRYFAKSYAQATAPATNTSANGLVFAQSGASVASTAYFANVPLPVTMRANPTVTIYSFTSSQTARVSDGAGTDLAASSGATNLINDSRFTVQNNSGSAITAASGGFVFHYTVSAEL